MKKLHFITSILIFFIFIQVAKSQDAAPVRDSVSKVEKKEIVEMKQVCTDSLLDYAKNYLGVRYKYAGNSPKTGFDCSGFVNYVYKKYDVSLPRSSKDFDKIGIEIPIDSCMPGDIALFERVLGKKVTGHVALIIEKTPDSFKYIHATTRKGIMIDDYKNEFYYKRFRGIRRVAQACSNANNSATIPENKKMKSENTEETTTGTENGTNNQ